MLERAEYIEQAYLFRTISERLPENLPLQDILRGVRDELLATTKLPMAVDFILSELSHSGVFAPAMRKLAHYFTPFQAYVIEEAENERGRFDIRVAVEVLRHEAAYRVEHSSRPGMFLYQFETLCRNRMRYDPGLRAISNDPIYDGDWRDWILTVRRQVGIVDLADLVYVRSELYQQRRAQREGTPTEPEKPVLFGEKEGKIAYANRRKDPLFFFSALQRHLGYPTVPRIEKVEETRELIPQLLRRMERLETQMKLVQEEQRGGIDITKFYSPPDAKDA